jgi:ubiquinone/menaquinone biosynthesis C-methylase UbiE
MSNRNRVCPVELSNSLDNNFRKWLQNPIKILKPYLKEGMTVLDVGCGLGFFRVPIAELVGRKGKVIAADLQDGMLQKLSAKIKGTELEQKIVFHKCEADTIGIKDKVDFIFAFYMVHEVTDKEEFLKELKSLLNVNGLIFIMEPKFHVSKSAFNKMVQFAESIGLKRVEEPGLFFSRTVLLKN